MNIANTFGYKIHWAHAVPYQVAINPLSMAQLELEHEVVASSRIYFICKIRKPGLISRLLSHSAAHPEILYVGETFNKSNRYKRHEQILEATTLINNHDQLVIYFIKSRFSLIASPIWETSPLNILSELKDLNSKSSVWLLERLYIHLFKPTLNEKHKGGNIFKDNLIITTLRRQGIRYIHLDIGMNGREFQFWSPARELKSDWYYLDLETETLQEGMPELFP